MTGTMLGKRFKKTHLFFSLPIILHLKYSEENDTAMFSFAY
jgi:hypothetical protein